MASRSRPSRCSTSLNEGPPGEGQRQREVLPEPVRRPVASTKGRPVKGSDVDGELVLGAPAASTKGRPVKGSDCTFILPCLTSRNVRDGERYESRVPNLAGSCPAQITSSP